MFLDYFRIHLGYLKQVMLTILLMIMGTKSLTFPVSVPHLSNLSLPSPLNLSTLYGHAFIIIVTSD